MIEEEKVIAFLRNAAVLYVVINQLESFIELHGSKPEVIHLNASLRPMFVVDLIKLAHVAPQHAVQTPVWVVSADGSRVPIIYSDDLGERYIKLTNRKIKVINTL